MKAIGNVQWAAVLHVANTERTFGEVQLNEGYIYLKFGEHDFLFTAADLETAKARAERNQEDCTTWAGIVALAKKEADTPTE